MKEKFSFYFEHDNSVFKGNVLAICYKADKNEIQEYGLTGENILLILKSEQLDELLNKRDVDYLSVIKKSFHRKDIFIRIQSECMLGIYGDSHCDCESQRENSINIIANKGGIFLHLPQEGQGWGLHYKLKELELQVSGRNTNGKYIGEKNRDDAQKILIGNNKFDDCRSYDIVVKILSYLGLSKEKFILISESEKKLINLKKSGLNVIKFSDFDEVNVNSENLAEYLIKILNVTHNFDDKIIDKIVSLIIERKCSGRALSTLASIVDKIKNDEDYKLDYNLKKKILNAYNKVVCGDEKRYIVDESVIKIQNNFSCKVNSSIFKAFQNMYGKNIFDRITLEKMYYFEGKKSNNSIRIRSSKVLNNIGKNSIFMKGQIYVEQKTFNEDKTQVFQDEISLSKLRSFFENNDYDYVKRVEMITTVSENQIPGLSIYIKKLPNIENRVMDIYGKKEDIKRFINNLMNSVNRNVFNDIISNSDYEDENFTDYNLRFADIEVAIQEELAIYDLMNKGED